MPFDDLRSLRRSSSVSRNVIGDGRLRSELADAAALLNAPCVLEAVFIAMAPEAGELDDERAEAVLALATEN